MKINIFFTEEYGNKMETNTKDTVRIEEPINSNISPSNLLTKTTETFEGSGDSSFELEENSTPEKNIGIRKYRPKRLPSGSDNSTSGSDCISYSFINMEAVSFLKTPDAGNREKYVNEENLLDSLFGSCDVTQSGKVHPSHLVDCVHSVIMPMRNDDEVRLMEGLVHLLDPKGEDTEVDSYTFTTAFNQWVDKYRLENADNSYLDKSGLSNRQILDEESIAQWCRRRHRSSGLDVSMFSYGSLEGNGGEMSLLEGTRRTETMEQRETKIELNLSHNKSL
ncbi:uncharacterized protein [Antedon mediterranea]|uniref:uncharacterized protein n=1 Tax=Antedon mediterranea TaxID=105859 RepID=UPI003AF49A7F